MCVCVTRACTHTHTHTHKHTTTRTTVHCRTPWCTTADIPLPQESSQNKNAQYANIFNIPYPHNYALWCATSDVPLLQLQFSKQNAQYASPLPRNTPVHLHAIRQSTCTQLCIYPHPHNYASQLRISSIVAGESATADVPLLQSEFYTSKTRNAQDIHVCRIHTTKLRGAQSQMFHYSSQSSTFFTKMKKNLDAVAASE